MTPGSAKNATEMPGRRMEGLVAVYVLHARLADAAGADEQVEHAYHALGRGSAHGRASHVLHRATLALGPPADRPR